MADHFSWIIRPDSAFANASATRPLFQGLTSALSLRGLMMGSSTFRSGWARRRTRFGPQHPSRVNDCGVFWGCRPAVSNKRDLYNIMTASDHNVIGPVELKTSVILIKYHLTRSHSSEPAADKFIVGCGIIACLDILFQTISNSSGWVIGNVSVNEPTFEIAPCLLCHFRSACLLLLCYTRWSVLTHRNGWRVHSICLDIALIWGAEVIKEMSWRDGCAGELLDASRFLVCGVAAENQLLNQNKLFCYQSAQNAKFYRNRWRYFPSGMQIDLEIAVLTFHYYRFIKRSVWNSKLICICITAHDCTQLEGYQNLDLSIKMRQSGRFYVLLGVQRADVTTENSF